jgi:hypothetical protein
VKSVTAGERLYFLLRDEVLDLTGDGAMRWTNIGSLLESVSGGPNFSAYIKGATAIHAMRRLLRFWEDERPEIPDESQHVRKVATFIRGEMFPSIGEEQSRKIARAVVMAERASKRPINSSSRAAVLKETRRHLCYLCGLQLDPRAAEGSPEVLALEHLWPTSMGGDSIEANLLPACSRCQHDTQDALSWEWLNIHNLVLPTSPSVRALESVSRRVRYARHYLEALTATEEEHLSLKEAFLRLGPIKADISYIKTGLPLTFFDLQTA